MSDAINLDSLTKRRYLHIILPCFLISILAYLDRTNVSYAALTMNKDLGLTAEVFGMGAGLFFIGYFFFEIPGALIASRYSARWWLARIMFTWGIVCALMSSMTTAWEFYLYRFLLGAAEASLYPVLYAVVIPRWFNAKERAQAISIMLTSIIAAPIFGGPLAGLLLDTNLFGLKGWQSLFIVEGIPSVFLGVILVYFLPDWPKDAKWLTAEEKQYLSDQYEKEIAVKNSVRKYTIWEALTDKMVLRLCLIYFLWITGFWGFNVWMPSVLKGLSGWSNQFIGFITVIPFVCGLIGFIVIGVNSSRTGEKRWHVATAMFLAAIGLGLGPFVTNLFWSMVLVCIAAIGAYAGMGVWWTVPTSFLSGAAAAGAVGMINSIANLGGYFGPYVTGHIKDATGSFLGGYLFLASFFALAGLVMLTLPKKQPADAAHSNTGEQN